jgi:acyl-CoA thioesterase-2
VSAVVHTLAELLDLEQVDETWFRGSSIEGTRTRAFGGQVAAQALMAAGLTVEGDRPVHSMHAYFLRLGDTSRPLLFHVEKIRDGRAYSTRRVVVVQAGKPIFHANASFVAYEEAFAHQDPMPEVPRPEQLRAPQEWFTDLTDPALSAWGQEYSRHPIELRFVGPPVPLSSRGAIPEPVQHIWFRAVDALPAEPLVHSAALTYASDLYLLGSALLRHGRSFGQDGIFGTSIDHAIWFHSRVDVGEWLLYSQASPWAGLGRGLTQGSVHTGDGRLVATVLQEGLFRSTFSEPQGSP